MAIFKRIVLFMLVNMAIMITLSFVLNLLGVQPYLYENGIDYGQLMVFCLVWGMGGAFISLAMSRMLARMMMGVQIIDPEKATGDERWLLQTVHSMADRVGITTMPQVGIFQAPAMNAFATGPTKNRALVAVSSGLLQGMNRDQVEGVLAHEVSHVANGDMVTLTLVQGVVNAFVMFFARIAAMAVSSGVKDEGRPAVRWITVMAFEIVFGILGVMIVAAFSRWREFRADAGGAGIAGKNKMIGALQVLLAQHPDQARAEKDVPALAAFKISARPSGLLAFFSTHPPLQKRIEALEAL